MDTNLKNLDLPNFQLSSDATEFESLLSLQEPAKILIQQIDSYLQDENKKGLLNIYDLEFNKLADRISLPSPAQLKDTVPQQILCLYSELFFRHLYSKSSVTPISRIQSFHNYRTLFSLALNEMQHVQLPPQWVWDILDEFLYQFQSFWQNFGKFREELESKNVWTLESITALLGNLQTSSRIFNAGKLSAPSAEFLSLLGFFSSVAMIKLHTQQANYQAALDNARSIDTTGLKHLANYPACYISLHYYVGFSAMMLGRTYDAANCFERGLSYLYRIRQYLTRSYQYNILMKRADQILMLLTVVNTLTPIPIDNYLERLIRDKFRDKQHRMKIGDETAFDEAFYYAGPKIVDSKSGDNQTLASSSLDKYREIVRRFIPILQITSYLDAYLPNIPIPISTLDSNLGNITQSALESWKQHSVQFTFSAGFSEKKSPAFYSAREVIQENGKVYMKSKDASEELAGLLWEQSRRLREIRTSL
jgi:hypothetical protein